MIFSRQIIVFLLLFFSSQTLWSQQSMDTNKEAKKLLSKAGKSFLDLEGKKSLKYAKKSLELSLQY